MKVIQDYNNNINVPKTYMNKAKENSEVILLEIPIKSIGW